VKNKAKKGGIGHNTRHQVLQGSIFNSTGMGVRDIPGGKKKNDIKNQKKGGV